MYTEIVLDTELRWAEALADALLEAGALAASIEDANAGESSEEPLYGEPGTEPEQRGWRSSRIVALFDATAEVEAALRLAGRAAGLTELPRWAAREVPEADWVRLTQAQFEPIAIGGRLWVVPTWHALPAEAPADAVVVELDPGLAFGTGAHPTTRLCLSWLEQNLVGADSVIDYGCGSGILAIAAKKLGAGRVHGTDIDPQAIRSSIENARSNRCEVAFVSAEQLPHCGANVVIANILSNPLKVLAPLLAGLVAPRGALVLSGVLARQAQEVIQAYQALIELAVWQEEEGWVCLAGRKTLEGADL